MKPLYEVGKEWDCILKVQMMYMYVCRQTELIMKFVVLIQSCTPAYNHQAL